MEELPQEIIHSIMKKNITFRFWYYFRMGWSTYFAFIFAAINTLTVTYYLAIENIPSLQNIFPSFLHYIVIVATIGIPLPFLSYGGSGLLAFTILIFIFLKLDANRLNVW